MSLTSALPLSGDVLDFGAGSGILIQRLLDSRSSGTLTGADMLPAPTGLPNGVRWIAADLNDPLSMPAGSFDAVIAVEVIEHLENPRSVFREFHRLLRPGGRLLVTTPNQESVRSLAALLLRGHFVDFLDSSYPAHITALVRKDFERLAAETGFEQPRFLYTNHGGMPRLPSVTWQTLSLGLLRGRLFSDNLLVVTRRDEAPC